MLLSPCGELLHKLLCNRASQPTSQSAALVWGECSNTSANSACCTLNWPHVTAALFSSLFFFIFISSLLPLFPSPFSHFPIPSQLPDETRLMEAAGGHAGVWILPRGAGGFILGSRHCQIDFCLPFLLSAGMALCLSESVFHCESENDNSFIRRYFIGYIFLTATRNLILQSLQFQQTAYIHIYIYCSGVRLSGCYRCEWISFVKSGHVPLILLM